MIPWELIPLASGVVTTLSTSEKNSVRNLIDYTTYMKIVIFFFSTECILWLNFFNVFCHPIVFDIIKEIKLMSTQQVSVLLLNWLH